MADEDTGYTRGERAAGVFGLLLFLALAAIAADLASGGKLFRRGGGCGCGDNAEAAPDAGT
jgi:hypothetical protein